MRPIALPLRMRHRQRGGIAIVVGLSLAVVLGFAGLALDGGRLYVNKTELQNAADACALGAAYEMAGAPAISAASFNAAHNAGMLVATRHRADFHSGSRQIDAQDVTIEFGNSLSGGNWLTAAASPPGTSNYVRCTIQETGLSPWFMQILGFGDATVRAAATATLAQAQSNCAIPMGMCKQGPAPGFGLNPGQWYDGFFGAGGSLTGNFNWIDFTPPNGGASELAALLTGGGACNVAVGTTVGATGAQASLARAWNTRFGLYSGSYDTGSAKPDRTGYAYTALNWPEKQDAYRGSSASGKPNYRSQRDARASYGASVAAGNTETGLSISNGHSVITPAVHAQLGANRRIATAPIMDCAGWGGSQTQPILGWACVLMLNPIDGPGETIYMEYLGLASDPTSPCATGGVVGGSTSTGPLVPGLVQ